MLNQADNANIHIWASDLSFSYGRQGGRTSWEGWVDILRQNSLGWYEFVLNTPIFPYSSWRKLGQPAQKWASDVSHPDYAISRNSRFFFTTGGLWWSYGEGIWTLSFCTSQEKKSWRDIISPHYLNRHWGYETALLQYFQVCSWRNADLQARSCNSYLLSPILN